MSRSLLQFFDSNVCFEITQTLFHSLWQGLVIGLFAWCLARSFRSSKPQLRYGVYAAGLLSMALCVPVTFALIKLAEQHPVFSHSVGLSESGLHGTKALTLGHSDQMAPARSVKDAPSPLIFGPSETASFQSQFPPIVDSVDGAGVRMESRVLIWIHKASPFAAGVYLLGVVLMLVRLCSALWGAHRLRCIATPVTDPLFLSQIRDSAQRIGLKLIPVVAYCERIAIPAVAGALRPIILLPAWIDARLELDQLQIILAHEMAHIRRFDLILNVLQRLVETLLFFHPVVWYISRQLSHERENCCDDAVVAAGYGSVRYAHTLVRIAELSSTVHRPLAATQLAMLAASGNNTSQFKRRILRLLGNERQAGLTRGDSLTLILLAGFVAATVAGIWQQALAQPPMPREVSLKRTDSREVSNGAAKAPIINDELTAPNLNTEKSPLPATDAPANSDAATTTISADAPQENDYSGTVVDADGKPIAGAEIWYFAMGPLNEDPSAKGIVRRLTYSGPDGKFSFRSHRVRNFAPVIVAKAPGYCLDWMPLITFENNPVDSKSKELQQQRVDKAHGPGRFASRTLKLARAAGPVQGRLVDLEGQPLPDITVTVRYLSHLDFAMLQQAFEDSSKGLVTDALQKSGAKAVALGHAELNQLLPPVKTDANGDFSLSGIGPGQIMTVSFTGERVSGVPLYIVGREMETKLLPSIDFYPDGAKDVYVGLHFTHAIGPAVPVSGIVTEFQSGKPIANATVFVERLFQENSAKPNKSLRLGMQHINSVTDERGRYRLLGIPPGDGHVLNVVVPKSEPWLMGSQDFSIDPKQIELNLDIKVFRGIWIEGNLSDAETGEPIVGQVDYLALRSNPNIPQKFGVNDSWTFGRFPTDDAGHYRVAGLPGPGVLFVRNSTKKVYPLSVGAEKVESYNPKHSFLMTTPTGMPLSNWNLIEQINPPVDAKSYRADFTLSAGMSLSGRVLDADGRPASGVEVVGEVDKDGFFEKLKTNEFVVRDYKAAGPRNLFFKAAQNSQVGYLHLEGPPPADLTVTLQPAVTVKGRLIATETAQPAIGYSLYCQSTKQGMFRIDNTYTDATGRFEIKGLLAGNVYKMRTANVQRFDSGENGFTIDLDNAKPGDLIDLGDVTGKNAKSKAK